MDIFLQCGDLSQSMVFGITNNIYWTCVYIYRACKLSFGSFLFSFFSLFLFFFMFYIFLPQLVRKLQGSSCVDLFFVVVVVFIPSRHSTLD